MSPVTFGDLQTVTDRQLNVSSIWTPADYGYEVMAGDPQGYGSGTIMVSQTVYMFRVKVPRTFTCSTIATLVTTAGSSFTSAFASVHGENRTKLGETADLATTWNSSTTALKESALVTPVAIPGGPGRYCYVCLFAHATTPPTLYRWFAGGGNSTTVWNLGLTGANARMGTGGTGQTSIPTTPTLTESNPPSYWFGLK